MAAETERGNGAAVSSRQGARFTGSTERERGRSRKRVDRRKRRQEREEGGRTHVVAGVVAGLVGRVDERELRERARRGAVVEDVLPLDCPGRKPPFLAVKRPVRPYKNAIQNRFT